MQTDKQTDKKEVGINFRNWKQTSDRLIRLDPSDGSAWRFIKGRRTRNGSHLFTIEKVGDVRR